MRSVNPSNYEMIPTFPEGSDKFIINAIIETPRNQRLKFAFDPACGLFKLKTLIAEGLSWPYDYGFIPQTLGDDGDPLDVLFLCDAPTFAGCMVTSRMLGLIRLDKKGEEHDRILAAAVPVKGVAQTTDTFDDIDDVPKEIVDSIARFLVEYSRDEDNRIELKGVKSRKRALQAVMDGVKARHKQPGSGARKRSKSRSAA